MFYYDTFRHAINLEESWGESQITVNPTDAKRKTLDPNHSQIN